MNKRIILIFSVLIVFGCLGSRLSDSQIIERITPELVTYCDLLEDNAQNNSCPTCMYYVNATDTNFDESIKYINTELTGTNYVTDITLKVKYGFNTRSGEINMTFVIDRNGMVINKTIPNAKCI